MAATCGDVFETPDAELVCDLPAGHDGSHHDGEHGWANLTPQT